MTSANIWTGLTSILSKTKFIVSERTNPEQSISNQNSFYRMLIQMIYKQAYALVLPAKGMEASIKKIFGFENLSNCRIIHNPVAQLEPSTKVKVNNRKFILGVGRLSFEKGFDRLIDAFANLNLKNIDLLIVGEGAEYAKLIQQIKDLKLQKHVKLIGLKSNVQDYYHQAELFVLPSRNEGYPNALIEAMSLGCPSVAIDCDFGPAEIIKHNQNGLLVPNNNINKLSASIYSVLMNPILKNRISINAKKINRSNSIERISKHWQQLI
jgi:glycosyltransferase involved in cell wall biosynthesis